MITRKLFVAAIFLILAGCAGTRFTWEDAKKVKNGMTETEVVSILGKPFRRQEQGNKVMLVYSYVPMPGSNRAIAFKLVDGVVIDTATINKE